MAGQSLDDRLESVAPGDIIELPLSDKPEAAVGQYKVVHKDANKSGTTSTVVLTLEGDNGATFDVELPANTVVNRSLESKWESAQSPTPHRGR